MDQRDQELDSILEPLRGSKPTDLEIHWWKAALSRQGSVMRRSRSIWPLLAACVVGAVLGLSGTLALQHKPLEEVCKQELAAEKFDSHATNELTYVKLD